MTTDLIIFDCDGVLVDTEPVIVEARVNILRAAGFEISASDLRDMSGYSGPDAYKEIAKRLGKEMPSDIRERFRIEFGRLLTTGLSPISGVTQMLDSLVRPHCVASNGSHAFMKMTLGAARLIDRFGGRIFSADEVKRPKPHPDLFLMAAERMRCAPERCVVVEDSILGVTAARSANMRTIGFTGGAHCEPSRAERLREVGAELTVASMAELKEILCPSAHGS